MSQCFPRSCKKVLSYLSTSPDQKQKIWQCGHELTFFMFPFEGKLSLNERCQAFESLSPPCFLLSPFFFLSLSSFFPSRVSHAYDFSSPVPRYAKTGAKARTALWSTPRSRERRGRSYGVLDGFVSRDENKFLSLYVRVNGVTPDRGELER